MEILRKVCVLDL